MTSECFDLPLFCVKKLWFHRGKDIKSCWDLRKGDFNHSLIDEVHLQV